MDNIHLLHAAAGQSSMKRFTCPSCEETLLASEPLNVLMICTLCEQVMLEDKLIK